MYKPLRYLGAALLGLSVLAASVYLHLANPLGRRLAASVISNLVSDAIEGELHIEGVRTLWLPYVRADSVVVRIGEREPMHLRDVSAHIDVVESLWDRAPIFRDGRVRGGQIDLALSPAGEPWIERAFASASSSQAGGQTSTPSPDRRELLIDGVRFEGVDFEFSDGDTWARLDGASGRGRMWIDEGQDFQGRFWSASGRLRTSFDVLPSTHVRGLAVSIDPPGTSVVTFAGQAELLGAPLTVAGHAPHTDGSPMRLCVWTGADGGTTLAGVGGELLLDVFTGVSFDVRPSEAPSEPSCRQGASS